ncbi:MAG: hypothetical protein AAF443_05590 [Chlamydiota bacterium]
MRRFLTRFLVVGGIFGVLSGVKIFSPKEIRDCFSNANICSNIERLASWEVQPETEERIECFKALQQPFYQLATGTQFHAFVSADGRYVLKFFRHARWRLSPFIAALPLPPFLDKKRQQWVSKRKMSCFETFQSCVLAYRNFKAEMGLIYLQLSPPGNLGITVTVVDSLGKAYEIAIDEVDFVLQRRATRTDDYLLQLRQDGQIERAQKVVDALLWFALKRAKRGYFDRDLHFVINFGFIEDQVVQIDTGSLYCDPQKGERGFYIEELGFARKVLIPWLKKYYPELAAYATHQINLMQASFSN